MAGFDDTVVARPARTGSYLLRAEAWPLVGAGAIDTLTDGDVASVPVTVDPAVRLPWSMIFAVDDGPRTVAALAIYLPDAAASPRDVSVFSSQAAAELTRAGYPGFLESSQRHGATVLPGTVGWVVIELPDPVSARYVWFRVSSAASGNAVALSEVRALSSDEVEVLRGLQDPAIAFATLHAVDTSAYQGIDLLGLGGLSTEAIIPVGEGSGEASDGSGDAARVE